MQVACPQCGAPIGALTETRFYRCPFCSSSFVVQEGRGLLQYDFAWERDDRLAWSALADHLQRGGVGEPVGQNGLECAWFPYWSLLLATGERRLFPAFSPRFPEMAAVSLPPGDLRFVPEGAEYPPPAVPFQDAVRQLPAGSETREQCLVYLPLYLLDYHLYDSAWRAVVSPLDRKVYANEVPASPGTTIPGSHIALVCGFALLLLIEGFFVRNLVWRAVTFAVTLAAVYPLYYAQLKKEASGAR